MMMFITPGGTNPKGLQYDYTYNSALSMVMTPNSPYSSLLIQSNTLVTMSLFIKRGPIKDVVASASEGDSPDVWSP
jgi:hypothetical protein